MARHTEDRLASIDLYTPLTAAEAQRLAAAHPHLSAMALRAGWEMAGLEALESAFGPRLTSLRIASEGRGFWEWLARQSALEDIAFEGALPAAWPGEFACPSRLLQFGNVTAERLDLRVFVNARRVSLISRGRTHVRLAPATSELILNGLDAEPDGSWENLQSLTVIESRTSLEAALAAAPRLEQLNLYWPFSEQGLAAALVSRHWKRVTFNGDSSMPDELIRRIWVEKLADELVAVRHVGPFQEASFENGAWQVYSTR